MSVLRRVSVASQVAILAYSAQEGGSGGLARRLDAGGPAHPGVALQVAAVVVLLGFSGLFAGLGLGLMSLDLIGLEILVAAGQDELATDRERRNSAAARRIIPIRKQGNLLLTTLLLGNVSVNALTSILMADLTSGTAGFLISTVLIVLFGEIIPQALCTKHAIVIGSRAVPCVRLLLALFYVFAKPVSMVLDRYLGEDIGTVFTKSQIHEKQEMIDEEEGDILRGAMTYRAKTAKSVMTPASDLFSLPSSGSLDHQTIQRIVESGFSRVLIQDPGTSEVVAMVHVKDLIFVDPRDNVPLASFVHIFGRSVYSVEPDCKLDTLLEIFRTEGTHLALVKQSDAPALSAADGDKIEEIMPATATSDDGTTADTTMADGSGVGDARVLGVVTLEDVLEEILQDEILDEDDVSGASDAALSRKRRHASRLYADSGRLGLAGVCLSDSGTGALNAEALAQHLQETCAAFRAATSRGPPISCARLAAFLRSCATVAFPVGHEAESLQVRGTETGHCIVVLEGRLLAVDGEGNAHAAGPWTALAADSLVTQEGLFLADATVRTSPEEATRVLRISRADFQRRLLHPLPRRDSREEQTDGQTPASLALAFSPAASPTSSAHDNAGRD